MARTTNKKRDEAASSATIFDRSAGLLLPLASTPSRYGLGDMGSGARRVLEWCEAAGFSWWQMLPIGPLGPGNSPYASPSAFAVEPLYLSLEALVDEGWLPTSSLSASANLGRGRANYHAARDFKLPRLEQAFRSWAKQKRSRKAYERFLADHAEWLDPWIAFVAPEGKDGAHKARFLQFALDRQWAALRAEARARGVRLMGDVPIFVGAESADVQAHSELFRLDKNGQPKLLSGCPPDGYAADGQLWGHPHYAWRAHRAESFAWWRRRLAQQMRLFDSVRIDHFIGFHKAWEVPAGDKNARDGRWGKTPGRELLRAIRSELNGLPLVAEDLGSVDDDVFALRDEFGLPGMRVLQWGFEPSSYHAPQRCPSNSVVYPGTHDNPTTVGWLRGVDAQTRKRFFARTGGNQKSAAWDMWRCAAGTRSHTAIVQLQDLLGLGDNARMNIPGRANGNWSWRASRSNLTKSLATRCRTLAEATDRLPRR